MSDNNQMAKTGVAEREKAVGSTGVEKRGSITDAVKPRIHVSEEGMLDDNDLDPMSIHSDEVKSESGVIGGLLLFDPQISTVG
jgi:hypothetical protein